MHPHFGSCDELDCPDGPRSEMETTPIWEAMVFDPNWKAKLAGSSADTGGNRKGTHHEPDADRFGSV